LSLDHLEYLENLSINNVRRY